MFYSIRHVTHFKYDSAVSESIMELRMQPRTEGPQRCLSFDLLVSPRARVHQYRDHVGNTIHHFDVPGKHSQLQIVSEAIVETQAPAFLPDTLPTDAWDELDEAVAQADYWESLMPSDFAKPTALLQDLARTLDVRRRDDPLSVLRGINSGIFHWFDYVPRSTKVDSPIDDALRARKGVCQDFAHVMIALVRSLGIPCRYVSGYLYHGSEDQDRSLEGATHAWVEAFLPQFGWIGFDPTNKLMAWERHIRTAIGRDYYDVPPTRGIFKGNARSELSVAVRVVPSQEPPPPDDEFRLSEMFVPAPVDEEEPMQVQQQQQQ